MIAFLISASALLPAQENPPPGMVGRKAEEGQIKVYHRSKDVPLALKNKIRAHFSVYSREIRREIRHLLGIYDDDEWKTHLVIELFGKGDDVHSGDDIRSMGEIGPLNQFILKLQVRIHDRFKEEDYRLAFIDLILQEQMLSIFEENPASFEKVVLNPPDWLVHGFDKILKHRELGKPSYSYSGYLKNGQLLKVDQITRPNQAEGLNALSLEIFRASSSVLVSALCEQRGGGESMRGLLGDLAMDSHTDPRVLIRKHFPGFRETGQGVDKWWALQLATLAQRQSFEYYSPQETEKFLAQALEVNFKAKSVAKANKVDENGKSSLPFVEILKEKARDLRKDQDEEDFKGTLADYKQFMKREGAANVVANRKRSLIALRVYAFPIYRQVIDQYILTCNKLMKRDYDGLDRTFSEMVQTRQQIAQTLQKANDYLNHYEATRTPRQSSAFDNYFKFKETLKDGTIPGLTDPITNHLREVENRLRTGAINHP